ncbi:MAG: DUF2177 family protein [Erysipelotrichia bacterium]|jgi:uncharacterized membrane protein|nr:DUF2177 family protein [Bacilli bacterium]MDD4006281.1 DUF2177 family protein [Bacilli bacterium]NMV82174.1 DUF2177 family protein [Erysipelotrichia bacterium]
MFLKYLILIVLTFVVFLLLDLVWLVKISPRFYKKNLGHLMADKVNYVPAIIFYLIFIVGITLFVIGPAYAGGRGWSYALIYGAIFGLVTYSTYDLTNFATLKKWPLNVTLADIAWGTFLSTATAISVYYLAVLIGV